MRNTNIKKYIYCIMIHNIDHSSIKKLKKNYLDQNIMKI